VAWAKEQAKGGTQRNEARRAIDARKLAKAIKLVPRISGDVRSLRRHRIGRLLAAQPAAINLLRSSACRQVRLSAIAGQPDLCIVACGHRKKGFRRCQWRPDFAPGKRRSAPSCRRCPLMALPRLLALAIVQQRARKPSDCPTRLGWAKWPDPSSEPLHFRKGHAPDRYERPVRAAVRFQTAHPVLNSLAMSAFLTGAACMSTQPPVRQVRSAYRAATPTAFHDRSGRAHQPEAVP